MCAWGREEGAGGGGGWQGAKPQRSVLTGARNPSINRTGEGDSGLLRKSDLVQHW